MELTKEQVNRIDEFLLDEGVKYLDLRMELLDHIAAEVELDMDRKKNYSFDKLLRIKKEKYLEPYFQVFLAQKRILVEEQWKEKFNQFWAQFFTLPHILLTLGLTLFFWLFHGMEYGNNGTSMLKTINLYLILPGMLISGIYMLLDYFHRSRLLIMNFFGQRVWTPFAILNMTIYLEDIFGVSSIDSIALGIYMSFSAAMAVLALYGCLFTFRHWIKRELTSTYPLIKSIY